MNYRSELLANLAQVRVTYAENSASPRIDTVRNRLTSTVTLLETLDLELPDLHVLATDRAVARREAMVSGGERDYALDNHGDPRARLAYKLIAHATQDTSDIFTDVAHDVFRVLRAGEVGRPGRPTVGPEGLALALLAQSKRIANGEYTPVRAVDQPNGGQAAKALRVEDLVRDRDRWKRRAEALEARFERQRKAQGNGRKAAS